MTRNDLIVGPARCSFNGATWFTKDDIATALDQETFQIDTSPHGKIDERVVDIKAEATQTPAGQWNAAFAAAIWNNYANKVIGNSIFTAADIPFVVKATDLTFGLHTMPCAAVTKLPDIVLSAVKTMIGSMTVTGIRGLLAAGQGWSTPNMVYKVEASDGNIVGDAAANPPDGFNAADIVTQPYYGNWGAVAGFTGAGTAGFETEEGWTISFDLQTEQRKVDSLGTIDYKFKSIAIMAKCIPIGPTASDILNASKIQGLGTVRGQSMAAGGFPLTITGADTSVPISIPLAYLKTSGFRFGATVLRNNEIGFVGARPFAAGVQSALYTITAP